MGDRATLLVFGGKGEEKNDAKIREASRGCGAKVCEEGAKAPPPDTRAPSLPLFLLTAKVEGGGWRGKK